MNRTKISVSGIFTSDFYGIIFGLGVLVGVLTFNWSEESLLIIVPSTLLVVLTFWFFRRYKTVEFDQGNIYFKKRGQSLEISLLDVREVRINKWIPIDRLDNEYIIKYSNSKGQVDKVRFIPIHHLQDFNKFIETLKSLNKDVIVDIA